MTEPDVVIPVKTVLCCLCKHQLFVKPPCRFIRDIVQVPLIKYKNKKTKVSHIIQQMENDKEGQWFTKKNAYIKLNSCGHTGHVQCVLNYTQQELIKMKIKEMGKNIDKPPRIMCFSGSDGKISGEETNKLVKCSYSYDTLKDITLVDYDGFLIVQTSKIQKEVSLNLKEKYEEIFKVVSECEKNVKEIKDVFENKFAEFSLYCDKIKSLSKTISETTKYNSGNISVKNPQRCRTSTFEVDEVDLDIVSESILSAGVGVPPSGENVPTVDVDGESDFFSSSIDTSTKYYS